MKKSILFLSSFIAICLCFLSSCNDDNDNEKVSSKMLLPSRITQNYSLSLSSPGTNVENVSEYKYDDNNRLTDISQTYTMTSPKDKTVNIKNTSIAYDTDGRISQTNIVSSENSAISIVYTEKYTYNGDEIVISRDGRTIATIEITDRNILSIRSMPSGNQYSDGYQLDNKGNIIQYTYSTSNHTYQRRYTTDGKNGIFKQVNAPSWFLITQVGFYNYQSENRVKEMTSTNNSEYLELTYNELQYNNDDYPVSIRTNPSPDWVGTSSSTTTIEYVQAKAITK